MTKKSTRRGRALGLGVILAALAAAGQAAAEDLEPAVKVTAVYTADVQGQVGGDGPRAGRYLDNLDVIADVDLERTLGWRGATLHGYVLNNAGGAPNDLIGSLQGTDNIQVARPRVRLFELWVEQAFGERVTVRAGLYNLNSEFYVNPAAALLIAPPFGIGSELAATGPNGPSIFPSTSLGVRAQVTGAGGLYLRAAAVNAKSGVPGDPGGVDVSLDGGALIIAEAGVEGPIRFGVGAWRYTDRQDDIRDLDGLGRPVRRAAQGAYVLGERRLFGREDGPEGTAFFRAGVSDGDTTAFQGGWQAGLTVARPFAGRPDGVASIGVHQGVLGEKYRQNQTGAGLDPARAESGVEITYSDRLTPSLTVQPDLQYLFDAGGLNRDGVVVAGLRVKVDLSR